MKKSYLIKGITCQGCTVLLKKKLFEISSINEVSLNFESSELEIDFKKNVPLQKLQESIPKKYIIFEKSNHTLNIKNNSKKFSQLKPLFLILIYILGVSFFINLRNWSINAFMLDYMGLFFIFFSFFKFLDLNGFSNSFRIYDPIAKKINIYAKFYPIFEIFLGIMFLSRISLSLILLLTILVLTITTIGVLDALIRKKNIQCGCLGIVFQLPMTEVTLIENLIMIFMSIFMLIRL